MSAAKEIVIVEHSKELSLNARKEAGSNGSGDTNGTRAASTDGPPAVRRRLADERHSLTHHFSVGGQEGYVTVGLYEDGLPSELFIRMAKEGSTVSGLMDSFATAVSLALQYGVPLRVLCDKFSHTRFEPSGWSGNPKIGYAKSIMDYLFRWLELRFLKGEQGLLFELPKLARPQREVTDFADFASRLAIAALSSSYVFIPFKLNLRRAMYIISPRLRGFECNGNFTTTIR